MEHDFDILAARVLSGEATPEEIGRLKQILAQNAQLRSEFAELRATWSVLKDTAPLAQSFDERPSEPPKERLKQWQEALERRRLSRPNLIESTKTPVAPRGRLTTSLTELFSSPLRVGLAGVFIAALAVCAALLLGRSPGRQQSAPVAYLVLREGVPKVQRGNKAMPVNSGMSLRGSDTIRLAAQSSVLLIKDDGAQLLQGPQTFGVAKLPPGGGETNLTAVQRETRMHQALFGTPAQIESLLVARREGHRIRIYSPAGFTGNLTPTILWSNEPGKTYDLSLKDELAPQSGALFLAGAVSPVRFSTTWPGRTLAKDGLYRLVIAERGQPLSASEITFRTLAQANESASGGSGVFLAAAYGMLTANPPRLGDALAILLSLPPEMGDSELALRLKLVAFGQLGYDQEFNDTLVRLSSKK